MDVLWDVVSVEPQQNNTLLIVFENGEKRRFDMTPLLERKPFTKLKNSPLFMKAAVGLGTVVWPGDIDIAPETLWDKSVPV
ncbi:MAG: DUF2442 domain-containing protein [Candidatus Edwardsbacteria bacterium]|nr:DUF2442 domain-containing protein [Candidatus Edwardsbacteria bacterium]